MTSGSIESKRVALTGGTVWTPEGWLHEATVLIEGEHIAGLYDGPSVLPHAVEVVDVTGLYVLPGLIDTHSHHREPGFTHKEDITSATRAAAAGGVTVTVGMPNVEPPVTTAERYRNLIEIYNRHALVDFNVNPAPTDPTQLHELSRSGCLGFKVFMIIDTQRSYPHMPGLGITDEGQLLEIFEAVAPTSRPLMVHPHNQALMDLSEKRTWDSNKRGPLDYVRAQRFYDGIVWDTAIDTLLAFQGAIGTRLHVLHLVTTPALRRVEAAKAAGRQVTSEVNGFALLLGTESLIEERGPRVVGRLVPEEVQNELWAAIRNGVLDVFGSDHAPHTLEEKQVGWTDMWKAPSGVPQLQDYLAMLLTRGVHRNKITLDDLVRITSYNPAIVFGLYPQKGTIQPGSDADLVVVDPGFEFTFRDENAFTKAGWTPYHNDRAQGGPIHTLVRGRFVMRDRVVLDAPGWGRLASPAVVPQTEG